MPPRRRRSRSNAATIDRAAALRALVLTAAGEPAPEPGKGASPHERELLARPVAEWEHQDVVDAIWRGEALGTLAWALGRVEELPPYDAPFDHVETARTLSLEDAALRPAEELLAAHEAARLWHWRARTAALQRNGALELPARWSSVDQLVAAVAMRGFEEGYLPAPLRGDFRVFGRVYRNADEGQQSLLLSIAAERHYALEWLRGGPPWDDVVTDT